ncbi:hypothetical protein NDU88_003930 [Pleurodeles waltl]|uniref:Uncharacterized protein n=1 Tax=Pleurodeles waltl TaxID=8319 RepID=A0AAV7V3W5_PLEWA|nr:hypothetical protein NDU88_003930 [Pleurodeles waltl]
MEEEASIVRSGRDQQCLSMPRLEASGAVLWGINLPAGDDRHSRRRGGLQGRQGKEYGTWPRHTLVPSGLLERSIPQCDLPAQIWISDAITNTEPDSDGGGGEYSAQRQGPAVPVDAQARGEWAFRAPLRIRG